MTQEDKEELRYQVAYHLDERPMVAQTAKTIHRTVKREVESTVSDVEEACQFLEGLGYADAHVSQMGATVSYQITPAGKLVCERGFRR